MDQPYSTYSYLLMQDGLKAAIEAQMEPPIQTDYFLSGGSMNLIFIVLGAKYAISLRLVC